MKRIIALAVTLSLLFSTVTFVYGGVDISDYELINTITLKLNETERLIMRDAYETPIPATWTSSDESVATVNSSGDITPVKVGTVYMLTTVNGAKYCIKVIINPVEGTTEQESATIEEMSGYKVIMTLSIKMNETGVVQMSDSDGKPVNAIWTSSDESIATVDAKGNVTPKKTGTVYMLTTWDGEKYCTKVIITPKESTTESGTVIIKETTEPGTVNSEETVIIVNKGNETVVKKVRTKTKKVTVYLPSAVKIQIIANKKKSAKKIKITIAKIKNVKGYHACVYKNKKDAGKNKNAIVSKKIKKNVAKFALKHKNLKDQEKLFVRIRAYKVVAGNAYYGAWSKVAKVKIK